MKPLLFHKIETWPRLCADERSKQAGRVLVAYKLNGPAPSNYEILRERKEVIRGDLSRRLRRICAHLDDREFARLVDAMADQKLRGERRASF